MRSQRSLIGLFPERLTLEERRALIGQWIALELYDTQTLPLRTIAAIGNNAEECIRYLREHGQDPAKFEYLPLTEPY